MVCDTRTVAWCKSITGVQNFRVLTFRGEGEFMQLVHNFITVNIALFFLIFDLNLALVSNV